MCADVCEYVSQCEWPWVYMDFSVCQSVSTTVCVSVKVSERMFGSIQWVWAYKGVCMCMCMHMHLDVGKRHSTWMDFPRGLQTWLILSVASPQISGSLFSSFPILITLLSFYKRKVFPSPIPNSIMVFSPGCKILQRSKEKGQLKILFWWIKAQ